MTEVSDYEMWITAQNRAKRKILSEFWYDKVSNDFEWLKHDVPKNFKSEVREYLESRNSSRYKYAMFTINPKEGTVFSELQKKVEKALKKVWVENYLFCYEWRDKDKGLHVHIKVWIKKEKNPYHCKREIYNTFKHLVGNKKHVNVRYSNREGCFDEYIKNGIKDGKKKKNSEFDRINRELLNIPEFCSSL